MPELGMKRSPGAGDVMDEKKRFRGEDFMKIRLLLLDRYCGLIVGKKGENLERLRKTYNVHIDMPPSRAMERTFSVDGGVDDLVDVVKEIVPLCPQSAYSVGQECTYEINLLASTDAVPMVIGKGGEKLKEIRDQTQVKLKVYFECLPNSNERVVAIGSDSEESMASALRIILSLLKVAPCSPLRYYTPGEESNEVASGGMTASRTQMVEYRVAPDQLPGPFQDLLTTSTIVVPNDMCGAIIGKAGIRIREIRDTSGAKIEFSESSKTSKEDRTISIVGTQQQVSIAEQLMAECVRNRTV